MTFARLVLAATTNDPLPAPAAAGGGGLPPRQTANAYIHYYLGHVYSLFPFFSETALLSVLDDAYQQQQQDQQRTTALRAADHWLLYMALAVGATAQSKSAQDDYYRSGVEFAARALQQADKALAPGYVTQIQSLLLLTLYSMLDPAHFDSWHLIGITCRAVIDLGFHQDPPPSSQVDKAVLELRRKTFYCAYALDRSVISSPNLPTPLFLPVFPLPGLSTRTPPFCVQPSILT